MSKINYSRAIWWRAVLSLLLMSVCHISASGAAIQVQCPLRVAVGEQFQIRYIMKTTDIGGFRMGNIPPAFDVLIGPSTSQQQSFSFVNGHATQSSSVTYTYVLMAQKAGTYVIPSAKAVVDGKAVKSSAVKITVSSSFGGGRGASAAQQPNMRVDRAGSNIAGKDLFLRAATNKRKVYEQEPILLTYKVYTLVELTMLEGKMPDLQGFHTQEIPLPQQKQFHVERVGNRNYNCVTWSQYVMYPQMTGKLAIPSITFNGTVMQNNPDVDAFEAMFNGGSGYVEVKKSIKSPSVDVEVLPLPKKPADFSGGVGHFAISASLDKNRVKAGDPVTVRIVVSGSGNLKLLKQPELAVPNDFDKYDAKIIDKTKLTTEGVGGSMVYDILVVPRNKGSYTIPPVKFVYFDTQTAQYRTLSTPPLTLEVEKGNDKGGMADFSSRDDNDIHDMTKTAENVRNSSDTFFDSVAYWTINALVLTAFLVLVFVFRKRALDLADVTVLKENRAHKVATKRLKKALKLMQKGDEGQFYDEVLRALWGYAGDKFALPVEQLSHENITERLREQNVSDDAVQSFVEALDECEYARYAPGDSSGNMRNTYDKAMKAMIRIAGIFVFLLFAVPALADGKTDGDNAYRQGDYQKAVGHYREELQRGVSAEVYTALGNAHYRMADYPQAMLAYQRALKLSPADADIRHNIEITAGKTVDHLPVPFDVFFVKWYKALVCAMPIDHWAVLAVVSLVLSLMLFLAFLFVGGSVVQRLSFYGFAVLLALFLVSNLFAWQQQSSLSTHDAAVVVQGETNVRNSPSASAPSSFILHGGTCVTLSDTDIKRWYEVTLSDGRKGWLQRNSVEEI